MAFFGEDTYFNWIEELSKDDYVIIDDFIPENLYQKIRKYFLNLLRQREFSKAGIGTLNDFQIASEIRGDHIYWLDKDRDLEIIDLLLRTEELIERIKGYCFLSISDYELHLAHYPTGTFYKRHLDQFKERSNRLISFVLYLNENWKNGDGGELKIYRNSSEPIYIEPIAGRLVLFKSDVVEHEVVETNVSRFSITGWFLHQPVGLGFL